MQTYHNLPTMETGSNDSSKKGNTKFLNNLRKVVDLKRCKRRGSIQPEMFGQKDADCGRFDKSSTIRFAQKVNSKGNLSLLNFSESFQEELPDFLDLFVKVISNFSLFLKSKAKVERKELLTIFLRKINWLINQRKSVLKAKQ